MENQRITIWHTTQQRKIVGNAAPMAKNLQDYLDKHGDCEVYTGQDRPGAQKQENPMDVRPHASCPPAPSSILIRSGCCASRPAHISLLLTHIRWS